jgi:hypothetical protein
MDLDTLMDLQTDDQIIVGEIAETAEAGADVQRHVTAQSSKHAKR